MKSDTSTTALPNVGSTPSARSLQDLAVCLSIAVFLYFRVWTDLLTANSDEIAFRFLPPGPSAFAAAMVGNLLIAGVFWAAVSGVRRYPNRFGRLLVYAAFILALLMCGNAVRTIAARQWGRNGDLVFAAVGLACAAGMALRMRATVRLAYRAFLVASPLAVLIFAQALWAVAVYDPSGFLSGPTAPALPPQPGAPRVVWIIFDEMDYNIAFDRRPAGLALPEIDRFRDQSTYTTRRYATGDITARALTGMIAGRIVRSFHPLAPNRLELLFEGSDTRQDWTAAGSVFRDARELGLNTAALGWYIPFCRLINADLTRCWWCDLENRANSNGDTFAEILVNQARSLFETTLYSPFGQSVVLRRKVLHYRQAIVQALSFATDPSLGLVLLHFDVPHEPFIYDRGARDLTLANPSVRNYTDSLALADVTLGRLRREMETAGLWDSTGVIISSDHNYRDAKAFHGMVDERVPLMIKLPGQTAGHAFDDPIQTAISRELIREILARRIATPADTLAWLSKRRATDAAGSKLAHAR